MEQKDDVKIWAETWAARTERWAAEVATWAEDADRRSWKTKRWADGMRLAAARAERAASEWAAETKRWAESAADHASKSRAEDLAAAAADLAAAAAASGI